MSSRIAQRSPLLRTFGPHHLQGRRTLAVTVLSSWLWLWLSCPRHPRRSTYRLATLISQFIPLDSAVSAQNTVNSDVFRRLSRDFRVDEGCKVAIDRLEALVDALAAPGEKSRAYVDELAKRHQLSLSPHRVPQPSALACPCSSSQFPSSSTTAALVVRVGRCQSSQRTAGTRANKAPSAHLAPAPIFAGATRLNQGAGSLMLQARQGVVHLFGIQFAKRSPRVTCPSPTSALHRCP